MKKQRDEEIKHLGQLKDWISLNREFDIIDLFSELHPADIADLIDNLEEQEKYTCSPYSMWRRRQRLSPS